MSRAKSKYQHYTKNIQILTRSNDKKKKRNEEIQIFVPIFAFGLGNASCPKPIKAAYL
jgi:hypothetical protein